MDDANRDESCETSNIPGTDPDSILTVNGRQPLTGEPRSVCLLNGGSPVSSTASYSKDEEMTLREPRHNTADWPSVSYRWSATPVDSLLSTAATGSTDHPAHSGGPAIGVALAREEKGVPYSPEPSDESESEPRKRKVSPTPSDTNYTEDDSPRATRARSSSSSIPGAIHPCNIPKSIMRTVRIVTNASTDPIIITATPTSTEPIPDTHHTPDTPTAENIIMMTSNVVGKYFLHPNTDLLCRVHRTLRVNSELLVNYRYPSNAKAGKLASATDLLPLQLVQDLIQQYQNYTLPLIYPLTTAQSFNLTLHSSPQEEIDNCSLSSDYLLREYHTGNPAITYAYGAKTDTLAANVPRTYNQAMKSVEKEFWEKAIAAEIQSMITHDVWQETIIPRHAKPITTKWVFRPKCDINGNIVKYKARLVARGFEQVYGRDFDETYSPVTRLSSLRLLFALASQFSLVLFQMDVETAFLNAPLQEEVYISVPQGISIQHPNNGFRLKRALYGLKQSPRAWYDDIHKSLTNQGYKCMQNESCLFYKHSVKGPTIIALYVDDLIIAGKPEEATEVKDFLNSRYTMKDLGEVNHILGCEVFRDLQKECIYLTQRRYILSTVKRFLNRDQLTQAGTNASPMESSIPLTTLMCPTDPSEIDTMKSIPYREAIGSLLWLVAGTRPDIAFAVQSCARFCANPGMKHWKAVLRIFRYLHRTINFGLVYRSSMYTTADSKIYNSCNTITFTNSDDNNLQTSVTGYSDSDWGRDPDTRRSISGYLMFMNGCLIGWCCKRQTSVALSSMEAEYMALCLATQEAVWLIELMHNLNFMRTNPITIFEDNQATIEFSNHNLHHAKSKHIQQRYHYTRESVKRGHITLAYVPTSENPADIMTKPLPPSSHRTHFLKLMIYLPPSTDQEIDSVPDYSIDNVLLTAYRRTQLLPAVLNS